MLQFNNLVLIILELIKQSGKGEFSKTANLREKFEKTGTYGYNRIISSKINPK